MLGTAPDHRLACLAGLLADRYEFLSLLGTGGSGAVYEVHNRALDRLEALKVLSDSFTEENASDRFTHEAKVAAALDHPRIVKVHNFGREDGIHWYSMQLVDGPALSDLLEAGLAFDATMLARLAIPILAALEYSHGRGVIHRDIKPANILFNGEGRPFLTDFGVAKTEESVLRTRTGHMLGTPAYVSPEQALGDTVDARADQYSLGITLYKTLAGRLPFSSDNVLQTLVLRLKEDPESILKHRPDLDPDLASIVMRSLARDRVERWGSVAEMRRACLDYCGRAGLRWDRPLDLPAEFHLARKPLARLEVPASVQGSFEPTADLPLPPHSGRRWRLTSAAGLAFALAGWLLWPKPTAPAPKPAPPATMPSPPVPAVPVVQVSPAVKRPEPVPTIPRRPVIYPQLVEGAPVAMTVTGCAGLRVNVSLLVAEDGTVKACKVLSAIPPECAEAAKAIASRYRFKPALDAQGQPLETTVAAAVDFPEAP